jgi:hypothetical protein
MSDKVYWEALFALPLLFTPVMPLVVIGVFIYVIAREYHHHGGWK